MKKIFTIIGVGLISLMSTAQNALDFEETIPNYVQIGTSYNGALTGTNSITVESWINLESYSFLPTIIGDYGAGDFNFLLRIDGNKATFHIGTGGVFSNVQGTTTIPLATWTHIAGVWDGTNIKIYVNGVLENTTAKGGVFDSSPYPVRVGASLTSEAMDGMLDNVRVWSSARTNAEISANMNVCLTGAEAGLIALYDFEAGAGTVLNDITGNGYNGNFVNSPTWVAGFGCSELDTIAYSGGAGVNGGQTASTTLNNFSTCQTAVNVWGSSGIWNGVVWSSGTFNVIVNGLNIGNYASGTTVDLTAYIPVTSVQLTSNAGTWHTVNAYVSVISDESSMPAAPTVSNVNYCLGDASSALTATLTGAGTTLKWYTTVNGDGYSATAPTPSTAVVGTTTYWVSQAEAGGCESLRSEIVVTVGTASAGTDVQVACDTYTWIDGNTYNTSNNAATFVLVNAVGCDSVVTLNLTIKNSSAGTDTQVACDTYTWIDGNTYNANNNAATFTLTNAVGCDSVVTLNLTINNSNTGTDTQVACNTYTWIDGNTYNANNNAATFTLTNAVGCDSVVTLNLTINNSNTGTDTQVACDTYTWIDGNTYNANNNAATFTLTNAAGCDSVVTLNLTINNSNTGTDVQVACDTYTWIDGNTYNTSNNAATFTLTNMVGCDSVVTLNLTINNSSVGTDTQVACDTYTWIDGNTYNANNNAATFTLTNAVGCDSVVTLNLTINNSNTGTDVQVACDTYTWIDGNTYNANNNAATFTLTNAVGCDSVVTLDLTINNSNTGIDVITACDSIVWIDGITYNADNNVATFTLTNAAGCDSVVTLDLTIAPLDITTTLAEFTITATQVGVNYQWIDCNDLNAPIVGETNQSFTAIANGDYAVVLTSPDCSDTSDCVTIAGVGIDETRDLNVSIYPNPNNGEFYVSTSENDVTITIYTIDGKVILNNLKVTEANQLINLNQVESGIYFVKISNDINQKTIRLIIE